MWKTITAGNIWHGEICNRKKNGSLYWEQATISPVKDSSGTVTTNFIAIKEDITKRKELEELREDVERIMRHDLKTPLNGIIGLPQAMMMDENLTPHQVETLRLIQESGDRLLNQINLSLDLYKMETGAFQYVPQPMDMTGLLKRIFLDQEYKSKAMGVSMDILVRGIPLDAAEPLLLMADETLCYTMVSNLLNNALEASPAGGRATVRLEEDNNDVAVSLHNLGTVPKAIRDNFFDKYVTHGKTTGTGLGTYSAKLMAEAQGGAIEMKTSDKEGTTLTIRLPTKNTRLKTNDLYNILVNTNGNHILKS